MRADQPGRAAEAYLAAASAMARRLETRTAMVLARRALEIDVAAVIRPRIEAVVRACGRPGEALCESAARAHVSAGRFDAAVALRELLVECDPGSVTKTLSAAQIGLDHGDPSRAALQLVEAASRMHATGRTGEYVRIAETMLACGRHDPDTILELARIYVRRGQPAEAVIKLELLLERAPGPESGRLEVVELLVRCHAALGETARAIARLEETLHRSGQNPGAVLALCERAEAFDSRDPGFAAAVRQLRARPVVPHRVPPPPPVWATRRGEVEPRVRAPSESSGIGWPAP